MKRYTIEISQTDKGLMFNRTNEGFNAYELIGLLSFIQSEINDQLKGTLKPELVTRKVIKQTNIRK